MKLLVQTAICVVYFMGMTVEARAGLTPIGPGQFPAGSTLVNFNPFNGDNVQNLTIGGVSFQYSSGGPNPPFAVIDGGPGLTNHITPPNIVSEDGNPATNDVLVMTFARPEQFLGYGFALLDVATVASGSTVTLFDASNNLLGSLSVGASPDPFFAGGFLGVESTTAFTKAIVTFGDPNAQAFALGNIMYAVPEPSSFVMGGLAVFAGLAVFRRRRAA